MEIKINIAEAAKELINYEITSLFGENPESVYEGDPDDFKEGMQQYFDEKYDIYYNILLNNKVK